MEQTQDLSLDCSSNLVLSSGNQHCDREQGVCRSDAVFAPLDIWAYASMFCSVEVACL